MNRFSKLPTPELQLELTSLRALPTPTLPLIHALLYFSLREMERSLASGLDLLTEALMLSEYLDYPTGVAYSHLFSIPAYIEQGEIAIAESIVTSLEDSSEQVSPLFQARYRLYQGRLAYRRHDIGLALVNLLEAESLFEGEDLDGLSNTYGLLAGCYMVLQDETEASDYAQKAYAIALQLNDDPVILISLNNLVTLHALGGKIEKPEPYIEEGMRIARRIAEVHDVLLFKVMIARFLIFRALFMSKAGQIIEAQSALDEAWSIIATQITRRTKILWYEVAGQLAFYEGKIELAIEMAQSGLIIAEAIDHAHDRKRLLEQLLQYYRTQGEFERAFVCFEQLRDLSTVILTRANVERIGAIQQLQAYRQIKRDSSRIYEEAVALQAIAAKLELLHAHNPLSSQSRDIPKRGV